MIEIHNDNFVLQIHPKEKLSEEDYFSWKNKWLPIAEKIQVELNRKILEFPVKRYDISSHEKLTLEQGDAKIIIKFSGEIDKEKLADIVNSVIHQ